MGRDHMKWTPWEDVMKRFFDSKIVLAIASAIFFSGSLTIGKLRNEISENRQGSTNES